METIKPKRITYIRMLGLLVLSILCSYAQVTASPYRYAQVLTGIGNHHTIINSAAKDHSGIIWVVSGGSLYRHNGVLVTAFSKLYTQRLPFDEVTNVVADAWGYLWIDTRNGLQIFDLNTWSFVGNDHHLHDLVGKPIVHFYDMGESLYVAIRDGSVWLIEKSTKTRLFYFEVGPAEERRPVGKLLVADDDNVWLAHGGLLYRFNLQTKELSHTCFPKETFTCLEDMLAVAGGVLIRVYSEGYYAYDGQSFLFLPREDFRTNDFTNWNHWSFTTEDKVVVFHEDLYLEYSRDTEFRLLNKDTHIIDVNVLHKRLNAWQYGNNEWLLCTNDGLYSVFPAQFRFDYLNVGSARGMVKHQGQYYFGGYGYLHTWSQGDHINPFTDAPENNYYAFLPWSEDTVCIATEGDFLHYLIKGKVSKAALHMPANNSEHFSGMAYCLARYAPDTLLVGTANGIWKYAVSSGGVYPYPANGQNFFSRGMHIQAITIDDGTVGFSTPEGFFEWKEGIVHKVYPRGGYKLNVYTHLYHGDSLYLGTKGSGLVVLDRRTAQGRVIRQEDGLASNTVYNMAWVEDVLVMGTHEGLSIMKAGKITNYCSRDGLPFEEFNHQAIYYDRDESWLFIGGVGGYIRFQLSNLTNTGTDIQFTPALSGLHIGMKGNKSRSYYAGVHRQDTIHLPHDAVWLSMDFARPDNYRQAYKILFKITPLMDEYQELPISSQINASGIAAGTYVMSVKVESSGNHDEVIRTWVVYKRPVFTETFGFFALLSTCILGISGYILYERSRKANGERKLRSKISRDLHDEVGGLLTGIAMQADLLGLKDAQVHTQSTQSISGYSREAIQTMDDIIWTIDSSNNEQGSLSDRMKLVATQLLEPLDTVIIFEMDQKDSRKMAQSVRQNLYLIFREAIHNVCKHSNARFVRIGLRNVAGNIDLYVCDDGRDIEKAFRTVRRVGYGLSNMQKRADQISAKLRCGFTANGYEVWVHVPNNSSKWIRWIKFRQ